MNIEVLAPGGSIEGMKAALAAGADAVYMGGRMFGARAYADNPDEAEWLQAIEDSHLLGRKIYMTVNTLLKDGEIEKSLFAYLAPLYEQGLDAVLVQDQGVLQFIRKEFPGLPIHASTQMSVQSPDGARLLASLGAERIVPARELTLREIAEIHAQPDLKSLEIECFVHGALCYSYSGQCLMSSLIGGRSGNRGRCAQPCRQSYRLYEGSREMKNRNGSYLLSLKDIYTLQQLPDLLEAGVCSLKIEGRMKQPAYAAGVSAVFRKYVDLYLQKGREGYEVDPEDLRYLMDLYNRGGFSSGYYSTYNSKDMLAAGKPDHIGTEAARVTAVNGKQVQLQAMENLKKGDLLRLEKPVTIDRDIKEGEILREPMWPGVRKGQIVRRLRSVEASERAEKAGSAFPAVNIYGNFIMLAGNPVILTVSTDDPAMIVTVQGEIPQNAQNRPTGAADVEKALRKTGGTCFTWNELHIEAEDGLYYPLTALNALRREALSELSAKMTGVYRRTLPQKQMARAEEGENNTGDVMQKNPVYRCFVRRTEQMEAVIASSAVDTIILDSLLWLDREASESFDRYAERIRQSGKRVFLALPPVWREKTRRRWEACFDMRTILLADGLLLRCQDQLLYARQVKGQSRKDFYLCADHNLYAWNRRAAAFWMEQELNEITLPLELNAGELAGLKGIPSGMVIYGRSPMMTSAQCLVKNTEGCRGTDLVMMLEDRTGAKFPVQTHCGICTNVIYNSLPMDLTGLLQEKQLPAVQAVRLDLTIETKEETELLMQKLQALLRENAQAGHTAAKDRHKQNSRQKGTAGIAAGRATKGHFRRGVE